MSGIYEPPKGVTQLAGDAVRKLDPNMLGVLTIVMVLNGLFFWTINTALQFQHDQFVATLNACQAPRQYYPPRQDRSNVQPYPNDRSNSALSGQTGLPIWSQRRD